MMVSFTKNLDGNTVNTSTVELHDTAGLPVTISVSLDQERIILITPTEQLDEESTYTLLICSDISDLDGLLLGQDISWSFQTGTIKDTTPPEVTGSSPHRGDIASASLSSVSITFSEAVLPSTISTENIYLKDNDSIIPAIVTYQGTDNRAILSLSAPLEENTQYFIMAKNVQDLGGNVMKEVWTCSFSTGVVQETETGIQCNLAAGWFGATAQEQGRTLRRADGTPLLEIPGLSWGDAITHLMDLNSEGPLAEGKYLRLVVNGKNVAAPDGMNLTPVLKRLTVTETPPAGKCYIDPLLGRFVLPRPLLWSSMDSIYEVYSPRIKPPGLTVEVTSPESMTVENDGERTYIKLENFAQSSSGNKYVNSTSSIHYQFPEISLGEAVIRYDLYKKISISNPDNIYRYAESNCFISDISFLNKNGILKSISISENELHQFENLESKLSDWKKHYCLHQ